MLIEAMLCITGYINLVATPFTKLQCLMKEKKLAELKMKTLLQFNFSCHGFSDAVLDGRSS